MIALVALLLVAWPVAIYRDPIYAVAATMTVFVFEQYAQFHVPLFVAEPALINLYCGGLILFALLRRKVAGHEIVRGISHPMLLLIAMYALHPISALWAPDPDKTLGYFALQSPYVLTLTFLTALIVNDVEDLNAALRGIWFCGSLFLILILTTASFAEDGRGLELQKLGATSGTKESNPLALAGVGGEVAILAMIVKPMDGWRGRLICGATAIVGLYTCVRSGSRGQFLAAIIVIAMAIGVQTWLGRTRLWKVTLLTTAGAACIAWLLNSAAERFGKRFAFDEMQHVYESGRMGPSEALFQIWSSGGPWTWVWGLGGSSSFHYVGFYPHVVPVEVLAELGVVGFLLYIGFAVLAVMRLRWLLRTVPWERYDAIVGAGALFAFEWILALKQGALLGADYMMCHGLIICGVAQNLRLRQEAMALKGLRPNQVPTARPSILLTSSTP